jgi:D-tyrosyl-tRNA(Tyr) deacylase
MRAVIQRVDSASVSIGGRVCSSIGRGLLIYLAVEPGDGDVQIEKTASRLLRLKFFADTDGRLGRNLTDVSGELMVVSQFTLMADLRKGSKPSFSRAALPEKAIIVYEKFVMHLREKYSGIIETGEFGADMQVESINNGPLTFIWDC